MDPKAEERKRKEEGRLEIIKAKDASLKQRRRRVSSIDEDKEAPDEISGQKVIDIKSTNWKSIIATGKERKSGVASSQAKPQNQEPQNDFFLSFDSAPVAHKYKAKEEVIEPTKKVEKIK